MTLHKDHNDPFSFSEFQYDEDPKTLEHKKQVRRMLEERLERKRLKEELDDELEGEFDWDDFDR